MRSLPSIAILLHMVSFISPSAKAHLRTRFAPLVGRLRSLTAFRVALASAFLLCSAAVIFATWQNEATARWLGDRAVESTGLALATSVENALRAGKSGKELRAILSDRVVAYALIAAADGTILFHVNPDLVGTRLPEIGPEALSPARGPSLRRVRLRLGPTAYAYDYPLRTDGRMEVLRLVLHMGTLDRLEREARQLWTTVVAVLALLAAAGVGLDRLLLRQIALRDEVARRERLSLIGQMTATLAHEVRNALWGVKGYAQWLDEKLAPEHPGKPDVAAIVAGAGRIEGLVEALLGYSREESYRLEPVPVAPLIDEALSGTVSGWGGSLRSEVDAATSVLADRGKLLAVLVNAVRNSLDAMGPRGTLTLRTASSDRGVTIEVEDTGGGVSADAQTRIFTPFFTTKVNGTGLGLAYSRKVVEGMKGTITLHNRAGGAVLTVCLPRGR